MFCCSSGVSSFWHDPTACEKVTLCCTVGAGLCTVLYHRGFLHPQSCVYQKSWSCSVFFSQLPYVHTHAFMHAASSFPRPLSLYCTAKSPPNSCMACAGHPRASPILPWHPHAPYLELYLPLNNQHIWSYNNHDAKTCCS